MLILVRGVPDEKVQEMLERFEDYEGEEINEYIQTQPIRKHGGK